MGMCAPIGKIGNLVKKMTLFGLFIPNRFCKTSLYRALIAQDFARAARSGNLDPEEAFAGGRRTHRRTKDHRGPQRAD